MMGDLKQENNALTERVRKLTDDNTRMAKRIDSSRSLSDLTEALDKLEELERDESKEQEIDKFRGAMIRNLKA